MFSSTSFLFVLFILLLCGYTLHKVRLVHLLLHEVRDHALREPAGLYRQLEALQGLYAELNLSRSLPATRGWAASPDLLLELARHAQAACPQVVVECSSGTSTLVLARCMQLNGTGMVYSLEHDPVYAQHTRRELERHGLSAWAQVLDAPLQPQQFGAATWPWYAPSALHSALPAQAQVDLLVIDGPPQATRQLARYPAGPALFPLLADGAVVFLDDSARPDEQRILALWKEEFPELEHSSRPCEKGCALLTRRAGRQTG